MSYDDTNRGQIWGNDKKTSDSHPDFKGSINVEGKEYWLSAWKRAPDANPKAPSLRFSVQPKEDQAPVQQPTQQPQQPQAQPQGDGLDDSIPFMRLDSSI